MATMRGKSYLQIGSICMGIAGSSIDPDFLEEYLGVRWFTPTLEKVPSSKNIVIDKNLKEDKK